MDSRPVATGFVIALLHYLLSNEVLKGRILKSTVSWSRAL